MDDIPANYITTISSIHDGTSFLTYDAPAVAVLLPSSLDAFVAEAAIESTRDQRETGGCKIYMFQKLEILPVVPDFYFICMEI